VAFLAALSASDAGAPFAASAANTGAGAAAGGRGGLGPGLLERTLGGAMFGSCAGNAYAGWPALLDSSLKLLTGVRLWKLLERRCYTQTHQPFSAARRSREQERLSAAHRRVM
jgi:hypothetical protein